MVDAGDLLIVYNDLFIVHDSQPSTLAGLPPDLRLLLNDLQDALVPANTVPEPTAALLLTTGLIVLTPTRRTRPRCPPYPPSLRL